MSEKTAVAVDCVAIVKCALGAARCKLHISIIKKCTRFCM